MSCTTLLVGKAASYDGSTMIARNDDSGGGHFTPKKLVVVNPEDQPKVYESVISHIKIELPDNPLRYTATPNAVAGEGFWAANGINEANVAMTATETIMVNERVLGADPILLLHNNDSDDPSSPECGASGCAAESEDQAPGDSAAEGKKAASPLDGAAPADRPSPGGIGEEDLVVLVLPYIRSAREGVLRLGSLLEQYGTYEMNGIAFSDVNEIWYMETIGGHHWMARRVPDHACAVIPNQLSIDFLDLDDALGEQKENLCSADLAEFIEANHLDLDMPHGGPGPFGGPHGGHGPFGGPHVDLHRGPYGPEGPAEGPEGYRGPGPHHGPEGHPGPHGPGCRPPYGPGPEHGPDFPPPQHHPDGAFAPETGEACCGAGYHSGDSEALSEDGAFGQEKARPHRILNARLAFGTHEDADHVYNTPRAWYMGRCLAPHAFRWDGPGADFTPASDDIPWCIIPEHKVTVEDVKYILSSHYQETPYDPYGTHGDGSRRGIYRTIGINRTDVLAILQLRGDRPQEYSALEWLSFASNVFNASVPFYANVTSMPAYVSGCTDEVTTESFYWAARLIAALSDACVKKNMNHIEIYQITVQSLGRGLVGQYDALQEAASDEEERAALRQQANDEIAAMLKEQTEKTLGEVLFEASGNMANQYLRSDH